MDLHRAQSQPDWELVPEAQRNDYQRRAAETNGWDTPANRETAIGVAATLAGLGLLMANEPIAAAGAIGYGRWKDINDGRVAAATGTKSPKGETIDVTADKILTAAAVATFVKTELLTKPEAAFITAKHLAITGLTAIATARGIRLHPPKEAKFHMFDEWLFLGSRVAKRAAENNDQPQIRAGMRALGTATFLIGAGLGAKTIFGYAHDAFGPKPTPTELDA
jgi:phosphatidylglycerophosphate synthase